MGMTRPPRLVLPDWVHHVVQRGNFRQRVFFTYSDRFAYLEILRKQLQFHGIPLLCYSLMDNHTHKAVIPQDKKSFATAVGQINHDFSIRQNITLERTGHLWQGRFYSCPVEGDRVWQVMAYIELNPVRAGLVKDACEWEWSSARAHCCGIDPTGILDMALWRKSFDAGSWRQYLDFMASQDSMHQEIRQATRQGKFLGSEEAARRAEAQFGIRIIRQSRGRKRKNGGRHQF
jgi:putative transposase